MTLDEYFTGQEDSRRIFDILHDEIFRLDQVQLRITKSQVAFYRRRAFAWAWIPGRYLRGEVPILVLTVALRRRDKSPRWKQVVEPITGRFTHHLELLAETDIDYEVRAWLIEAWGDAG